MKMEYYDSMGLLFESILEAWTNRFLNRSNPPSRFGGDSEQNLKPGQETWDSKTVRCCSAAFLVFFGEEEGAIVATRYVIMSFQNFILCLISSTDFLGLGVTYTENICICIHISISSISNLILHEAVGVRKDFPCHLSCWDSVGSSHVEFVRNGSEIVGLDLRITSSCVAPDLCKF